MKTPPPIERLVNQLRRLPGIGEKSATRLAFFLLSAPETQVAGAGRRDRAREARDRAVRGVLRPHRRLAVRPLPRREARRVRASAWWRSRRIAPSIERSGGYTAATTCSAARSRRSTAIGPARAAHRGARGARARGRREGGDPGHEPERGGRRHGPLRRRAPARGRRAASPASPTACRSAATSSTPTTSRSGRSLANRREM